MKESKALSILTALLTALLVVSGSVAVPLLLRPFYYAHIEFFDLTQYGVTVEQIKVAYDQMMDFPISSAFSRPQNTLTIASAKGIAVPIPLLVIIFPSTTTASVDKSAPINFSSNPG